MANSINVARYLAFKSLFDGDLISNLKMQKLLYFVYVWVLVFKKERIFDASFEAWCNGPVLREVYNKLREFGAGPIDISFVNVKNEEELKNLKEEIGVGLVEVIDQVYEAYGCKTPFELVRLSHDSLAWIKAREGCGDTEPSSNPILDEHILAQYAK